MEPELIVLEECNRFFIVQQRMGLDHPARGVSDSWSATSRHDEPFMFPCAYIFTTMAGPYSRVYKEWCDRDNRSRAPKPAFGYIVEARTKRQVVNEMVRRGHPAMFQSKWIYPKEGTMARWPEYPDAEIVALQQSIERAQAKIDYIASLPSEPPVDEDGVVVIYFKKTFGSGGRVYDYAAIKARDGRWYTTGPQSPKGYSWVQLIKWIKDGNEYDEILVADQWVTI